MMNKPKKRTGWIHVLAIPVTLMIVFAFSSKEVMKPLNEVSEELTQLIGPIDDYMLGANDLFQKDYEPSILPLKESDMVRLSSEWGKRKDPIDKEMKMHYGVDFVCPIGTEILATADGVVTKVQTKTGGYGKLLVISHGEEFQTKYAQLSDFKVGEGEKVIKGQVVALSGNSGRSTGPHLHYEVLKDGHRVNPMNYIKNYKRVLQEVPSKSSPTKSENQRLEEEERLMKELKAREIEQYRRMEELKAKEKELFQANQEKEKAQLQEMIAQEKEQLAQMKLEEQKQLEQLRYIEQETLKSLNEQRDPSLIKIAGAEGDPLFVIDGEIVDRSKIKRVNPDRIKSITVLKDKSAKKEYGSKGKNGVILIETKNKSKDKSKDKVKMKDKNKSKNEE